MNVLPLVSAFILIFGIGSYAFIHHMQASIQEKEHFSAAMNINRKCISFLQGHKYTKQQGTNLYPTKKEKCTSSQSKFSSPRDRPNPIPERKLNISKLKKGENSKLEMTARHLIYHLYKMTPFYEPGLEEEVLRTILQTLRQDQTIQTFEQLLPKVPTDQFNLLYKLIKGTHPYQLKTDKGYPPLGDFITLETSTNKPVDFFYASRSLLEVIFGETLAPQIIREEKHKWEIEHSHVPLTKEEFQTFLLTHRLNPVDYDDLIYFSTSRSRLTQNTIQDPVTQIQIKITK